LIIENLLKIELCHDLCACPVDAELQADAEVVLHAAHFPAERDLVLSERVWRLLELVAVDLELLAESAGSDGLKWSKKALKSVIT